MVGKKLIKEVRTNKYLYVLALPGIVFLVVFAYVPLLGHVLAFEDFKYSKGLFGSHFVGFFGSKPLVQKMEADRGRQATKSQADSQSEAASRASNAASHI